MSDPHVTITLGRAGQVVKRGISKRFIDSDGFSSGNKRLRLDHTKWRSVDKRDPWIARNDLRLKLIWKRRVKERTKRDRHEKMLKTARPLANANLLRNHPPRKGRHLLRQYPSREILNDLHPEDSLSKFYSSRTIDRPRDRSPGRLWTTMELSPPRSFNVLREAPAVRVADVSRDEQLFSNEVAGGSRQRAPISMKPIAQIAKPIAPSGSIIPENSLMGVEHLSVTGVLQSLGLGKYALHFQAEEVDMPALKQMSEKDLKELGIPMGPRKKILLAVKPCTKRQLP